MGVGRRARALARQPGPRSERREPRKKCSAQLPRRRFRLGSFLATGGAARFQTGWAISTLVSIQSGTLIKISVSARTRLWLSRTSNPIDSATLPMMDGNNIPPLLALFLPPLAVVSPETLGIGGFRFVISSFFR
ncbi:hypothetical protein NL676_005602 [Syzygium grande]|nr:hypothetical protein NL676_005602 [Syzygium grande]